MQKVTNELKLNNSGFLEFMILKVLSGRTYSLGEIAERLRQVGFAVPMGSLYPLFTEFRRKAFVTRGYEEGEMGTAIRTYQLTERGRGRLTDLRSDWKRLNAVIASL